MMHDDGMHAIDGLILDRQKPTVQACCWTAVSDFLFIILYSIIARDITVSTCRRKEGDIIIIIIRNYAL